jgi:hypothetical protein
MTLNVVHFYFFWWSRGLIIMLICLILRLICSTHATFIIELVTNLPGHLVSYRCHKAQELELINSTLYLLNLKGFLESLEGIIIVTSHWLNNICSGSRLMIHIIFKEHLIIIFEAHQLLSGVDGIWLLWLYILGCRRRLIQCLTLKWLRSGKRWLLA